MRVLTVNPGSSSLKLAVVDDGVRTVASVSLRVHDGGAAGTAPAAGPPPHTATAGPPAGTVPDAAAETLRRMLRETPALDAVAVRVVHGGAALPGPVPVDDEVLAALVAAVPLAPLHNPASAAAIRLSRTTAPDLPVVAVPDAGFHRHLLPGARWYALPWDWAAAHGLHRYGFHGLSHAWAAGRAAAMLDRPPEGLRLVVAHLGAGASLAAVVDGRSVDTTMGFTPLEGLVMATRSGNVDPGLLLYAVEHLGVPAAELRGMLEHRSGLLGLSGRSADLREVLAGAEDGDGRCRLAVEVMIHRLVTAIGAMVVAAGGLDALVFTGGAGEASPVLRRLACERLACLGVRLSPEHDAAGPSPPGAPDAILSPPGASVAVLRVQAREDLQLAREVEAALGDR